ncbi:MAG: hypothetical protein PHC81_03135 [Clostridia bacterium]|nr:hypothetical protein [Clostridia bacterium]
MIDKQDKKASKKSPSEISLFNIELYSINGQQLKCDMTKRSFALSRSNSLDIFEINDKMLKIKLSEKLFFKPEGPFRLDFDIIGTFDLSKPILEEEIKNKLEELSDPLFSYASMIIALITERFTNLPIILPPSKTKYED